MIPLLLLAFSCAKSGEVRTYEASLLELGTGFSAKEVCSCIFVSGRTADDCRVWTRVSPDVARFRVDLDQKQVRAKALGMAPSTARFVDERVGCVLVSGDATSGSPQ